MSYPSDQDILDRLPATCPELAAIFFPGYVSGFRRMNAIHHIERKVKSMEKYKMVRFTGEVSGRAKVWEMIL